MNNGNSMTVYINNALVLTNTLGSSTWKYTESSVTTGYIGSDVSKIDAFKGFV